MVIVRGSLRTTSLQGKTPVTIRGLADNGSVQEISSLQDLDKSINEVLRGNQRITTLDK